MKKPGLEDESGGVDLFFSEKIHWVDSTSECITTGGCTSKLNPPEIGA